MSFLTFFIFNQFGRLIAVATIVGLVAFGQGYAHKARLDRSATLQAIVDKKDIDLRAQTETAATANTIVAEIAIRDANNQEIIRDLQTKLATRACTIDDATARRLRDIR